MGGPALRCGGGSTRKRFGEDCPATAKAAVLSIEGLKFKDDCATSVGQWVRANAWKAESRHRWHLPYDVSTSGPHSSPQIVQKTTAAQDDAPPCTCNRGGEEGEGGGVDPQCVSYGNTHYPECTVSPYKHSIYTVHLGLGRARTKPPVMRRADVCHEYEY